MKMIKFLIFISAFSIISLIGYSKSDLTGDQIKNFNFKSGKLRESIFDKVQWKKINEKNGITLYMQKNKLERNNLYKAERFISSSQGEKLFKNLMDFDKYIKIFPRTILYKKIKDISKNKYLMYCQADFKPYKNRDYYILLEYFIVNKDNIKEWIIEWYPLDSYPEKFPDEKGFVRAKDIYGRWKIIELNDNVKISVEYYNDFNLTVTKFMSEPFEKSSTIEALDKIINYTNQ